MSKWINDRCYTFFDYKEKSFDDAKKICSGKIKACGFTNGRLYEPKDLQLFVKLYEFAEQVSKHATLQIWLGLNDESKEGKFVYNSNGKQPKFNAPWGGNDREVFQKMKMIIKKLIFYSLASQPNGEKSENCLTTFKPKNNASPLWYDRTCNEKEKHKFFCEREYEGK